MALLSTDTLLKNHKKLIKSNDLYTLKQLAQAYYEKIQEMKKKQAQG